MWGEERGADGCGQHQYPQSHTRNSFATTATEPADPESNCSPATEGAATKPLNHGADYIVSRDRRDANIIIIIIIIIIIDLHI